MVKQLSDIEIYLLIKYIKSVLWSVAKCLSYIEEARCLKVNYSIHGACLRMVLLTDVYSNLTSLWIKPRERASKQFKGPVLNVLRGSVISADVLAEGMQLMKSELRLIAIYHVKLITSNGYSPAHNSLFCLPKLLSSDCETKCNWGIPPVGW